MDPLNGIVCIPGASSGFGEACARRLARAGWALILVGQRKEGLEALAQELSVPVYVLALDLRDRKAVTQGLGDLPEGFIYCTRAILPSMARRDRGHIILIGSVAGTYPYPGGNVYSATKAFVNLLRPNLRGELGGSRVRITYVEPGLAESKFSLVRYNGDQQRAKAVYQGTEPIRAEDIAEIVFWMANLPCRLNVNRIEVTPPCQSFAGFHIQRG